MKNYEEKVFENKDEARKMANQMKKLGYKCTIHEEYTFNNGFLQKIAYCVKGC